MTGINQEYRSPDVPEPVPIGEVDLMDLEVGDIVSFRYWSVSAKEPQSHAGEVVDVHIGGSHEGASVTLKNENGSPRTAYKSGKIKNHYRTTEQSIVIGHDTRLRRVKQVSQE